MTDNGTIEAFRGDEQKAIERFKGDDTEVFPPGYFLSFSFCAFVFWGVMRGDISPLITISPSP